MPGRGTVSQVGEREPLHRLVQVQDVTDTVRATDLSNALADSERRYRHLFDRNPHPMWLYDSKTLRFLAVNRRAIAEYGYSHEEFLSMTILDIRQSQDRSRLARQLASQDATATDGDVWRHVTKSGDVIDVEIVADDFEFDGRPARLVVATDISARVAADRKLRQLVDHDPLTGVLSRRRLEREINALTEKGSSTESCAVAVLGLDHFKFINDSFGHQRGDELICQVASVLAQRLEPQHRLGRLGGDAFALLLPSADEPRATQIVAELLDAIKAGVVQGSRQITASAGIAACRPGEAVRAKDLLVAADIALYEAKDAGRDRWAAATGIGRGHTWIDEIRDALDTGRFVLHSQPIIDLDSSEVEREELLVRMVGRDGDLIPPASFVPASERFGLINHIDRWVVGQALELTRQGRRAAINLSAHSLGDREITGLVADAIRSGMDPTSVMFELTETALAANYEQAADFAERLSRIGCGFALDDFGTGYGTLTYLKHLPFSYLKIDREFVREIAQGKRSQRIVKVVVQTASELGQKTIAEGVEDAETMDVLRLLGVHYAQGYHIARPAPISPAGAAVTAVAG